MDPALVVKKNKTKQNKNQQQNKTIEDITGSVENTEIQII